jgi:glycerol-3-phosphate acyltransferase PlsY
MLNAILLTMIAYLIGSFSAAIVVCYGMNLPDPRTLGSGNPGATNVLRHGGKKAAFLTFLLDVAKGVIAVLLAKWLLGNQIISIPFSPTELLSGVTLAVFLGHLYPIFFNFRGGKGVATFFGAITALVWQVGMAALATWLIIAVLLRYSSLAALTSAFLTPIYMILFAQPTEYIILTILLSLLIFWRHRSNIRNLWVGTEGKIGSKST